MAYKKRRGYKKRSNKSSTGSWLQTGMSVARTATQALSLAKTVASLVNVEKKKADTYFSGLGIPDTGTVQHLTAIAQGDTYGQRNGNSVKATGLTIKGHLVFNGATFDAAVTCMIIKDNQQVADSNPVINNIIETAYGHLAPLNRETVGRYSVLWKETYNQKTDQLSLTIDKYLPMSHHIRYNGTASVDIQKGGIYFVAISNKSTNTPAIQLLARLQYVDN